MSLIYPFGLLLLPGIFRRIALKAEKADKNFLYKFSQLLEYIWVLNINIINSL